jgi:hypothetical protein
MAPRLDVDLVKIVVERTRNMKPITVATILRVGRKIEEGFDGEVVLGVKNGGVHFIRWVQQENGNTIKEELGL